MSDLGSGDVKRGAALLERAAQMLLTDDEHVAAEAERYAAEVARLGARHGGILSPELRNVLTTAAADSGESVLGGMEPTVEERYDRVDVSELAHVGNDLTSAFLVEPAPSGELSTLSASPRHPGGTSHSPGMHLC